MLAPAATNPLSQSGVREAEIVWGYGELQRPTAMGALGSVPGEGSERNKADSASSLSVVWLALGCSTPQNSIRFSSS